MNENYLAKWLNRELSDAELAEFKKTPEYAAYHRIIETADNAGAPHFDVERALAEVRSRTHRRTGVVRLKPWKKVWQVAAVLILFVGLALVFLVSGEETVRTQYAERSEVVLPDASEVVLNSGSEIRYDEKNWNDQRRVALKGEAFFRVAKGSKFTVATDAGDVSVLGTQFNVEHRNGYFEVICYEGLVNVSFNGKSWKLPGGASFLSIQGKIIPAEGPDSEMPSWLNNESSFQSTPLSYVLQEFERQYDMEVTTENIDLNQLYTGSFSNTNMNLALQSISTPSQISFKLEGNKVLFYAGDTP